MLMLVQAYGDNDMKKTAIYKVGETFILREGKVSLTKRNQDGQQKAELKINIANFDKFYIKILC